MDKQAFEQRFMKIISTFGAKNYSQDRIAIIYNEVKHFTASDFTRLIEHLIGSSKNAPLVPDFRRAVADLGLRPERRLEVVETTARVVVPENLLYHLDGNAWADNTHIYMRGKTIRECGFVVKEDQPHHPLVILDEQVREQRIKEVKDHLKKGTFPKFEEEKIGTLKRANFGEFL